MHVPFMTLYLRIFKSFFDYCIEECTPYHNILVMTQYKDFQNYAIYTYHPCQIALLSIILVHITQQLFFIIFIMVLIPKYPIP